MSNDKVKSHKHFYLKNIYCGNRGRTGDFMVEPASCLLFNGVVFPRTDIALLAIEIYAHFKQLLPASVPRQQVFFRIYLRQSLVSGFVQFELEAVYEALRLHERVYPSGGDAHLGAAVEA